MKNIQTVINEIGIKINEKFATIMTALELDRLKAYTIQSFLHQIPFIYSSKFPAHILRYQDINVDVSTLGDENLEICRLTGVLLASAYLDRTYKILPTALAIKTILGTDDFLNSLTDSIFNISIS